LCNKVVQPCLRKEFGLGLACSLSSHHASA
jgi:hypothetical protein